MLKDKLMEDMKAAMKSGDVLTRQVLSLVNAAIKNKELEKRGKLSKEGQTDRIDELSRLNDEDVITVISTEIKKRKESIETYEKGGRPELAETEKKEMEVLMRYMPEQMSEDQIREEVKKVISENRSTSSGQAGLTIKEMGKIIGSVMAKIKGKADGTLVSQIVKEELSK